jgi:hypothetical protein
VQWENELQTTVPSARRHEEDGQGIEQGDGTNMPNSRKTYDDGCSNGENNISREMPSQYK